MTVECAFTGCGQQVTQGPDGWWRHAQSPPEGIAKHVPHMDFGDIRVIDLTEMDEETSQ